MPVMSKFEYSFQNNTQLPSSGYDILQMLELPHSAITRPHTSGLFPCGHIKSLIYETLVEIDEELVAVLSYNKHQRYFGYERRQQHDAAEEENILNAVQCSTRTTRRVGQWVGVGQRTLRVNELHMYHLKEVQHLEPQNQAHGRVLHLVKWKW
ncbi:hypothetical protein ANN_04692 [Periplaneta americana]|uniref:Uncharacterized protein n=1 Tax=Periplaneta americana TaxID=6978 RepID=A0ABQ8TB63_PERAM|nr:hypothetical protein ANN_04692 [Periplaneta americana]